MTTKRWADLRPAIVAGLGHDALVEARQRTQDDIDALRLAGRREGTALPGVPGSTGAGPGRR